MNLIELSFSIEQRILGDHLEQHAAVTPDVHFGVVVPVGHETLGGSVPPGRDILGVGLLGVDTLIGGEVPLQDPKSASLMLYPEMRTFSGLISRWKIPLLWMYSMDFRSWYM